MKQNKILAVCAAAAIASSSFAPAVSAAQTYRELLSSQVQTSLDQMTENYDKKLEAVPDAFAGTNASLNVELNDTGRALLDMVVPVDLSWLSDAELDMNVGVRDGIMAEKMNLLLNDTVIASLNYLFELENRQICFQIPEISEGWVNMKMDEETLAQAGEEGIQAAAMMDTLANLLKDPEAIRDIYPSPETITAIVNRYMDIFYENIEESQLPAEQTTIQAGGITQDCTMVEASMTEQQLAAFLRATLETAKTDPDLKDIITGFLPAGTGEDPYTMFQQSIDDMLEDLPDAVEEIEEYEEAGDHDDDDYDIEDNDVDDFDADDNDDSDIDEAGEPDDDSDEITDTLEDAFDDAEDSFDTLNAQQEPRLISRLWADEKNTIIGRGIYLDLGYGEEQPVFTMMAPVSGTDSALELTVIANDEPLSITGTGTTDADGIFEGSYALAFGGQPLVHAAISGYDTISAENGIYNGDIRITPETPSESTAPEFTETLSAISAFGLNIHFEMTDQNTSNIQIQLDASGSPLGTIRLISSLKEMDSFPAPAESDIMYDVTDEDQAELYTQTVNPEKIIENLKTAGMPDQLLQMLTGALTGTSSAGPEPYTYDPGTDSDPYTYDTGSDSEPYTYDSGSASDTYSSTPEDIPQEPETVSTYQLFN